MSNEDVLISKINESSVKIFCPQFIGHKIRDNYKFFAPGYKYSPKYKNPERPWQKGRYWDGKVSLLDLRDRIFPYGLLNNLTEFLDRENITYAFDFSTALDKDYRIHDNFMQLFYKEIFKDSSFYPRDYQHEAIRNLLYNKRGVVEEATGCHIAGTEILMSNGSVKNVEDISVDDKLMGKNGDARTVLSLISGVGQLYKITPCSGDSFIVNGDHVLHLQYTNKSNSVVHKKAFTFIDISVNDYLKKSKTFKHMTKLVWNDEEITFCNTPTNQTKLLPYFVGTYLGNGDTYYLGITSMDNIADMLIKQAAQYGLSKENVVMKQQEGCYRYNILKDKSRHIKVNPINQDFKKLGLRFTDAENRTKCEDKFIPDVFKYGSIQDRYEILAGLIDTDGHLANGSFYEYTSKSKQLRDDVAFVARSLGFFVTTTIKHVKKYNKDYYKCSIQGDIVKIPCRVERKKYKGIPLNERQKKHNISGFKIESYNDDRYYGFRLDGDGIYMLGNYMLTHNSGKSLVIYCLIRYLLALKKRIVLIVPNIMLVEQMRREFIEYGWTACYDYLTIMYMNHVPDIQKPVLVSTYQSLVKQDDSFISRYNAAIVDEAHQAPANSIKTILGKLTYADYRLGMTGTFPDHTDPEELSKIYEIYGWLGPLVAQKSASELMDEGWLSRLKIANIIIKYPEIMCLKNANRAYEEEIITTTQNEIRNRVFGYILNHIPETENTIILCYLREHLEFIHDYLVQNFSSKFKIRKIHGDIAAEKRIKIQVEAETTGGIVIAATYGTMSIGVNIKRLHNIIMGSSHKGKIKIIQTIGRGLRLHETKDWLTMFDIVDDLRWEKRNRQRKKNGKIGLNHLWKHFEQRLKHYEYQKYPYTTKVIKLEDLQ